MLVYIESVLYYNKIDIVYFNVIVYYGFGIRFKNFFKYMYWDFVWWMDYLKEMWEI